MALFRKARTRWVDCNGKQCKAGTEGARKLQTRSKLWYGRYRDSSDIVRECRLATSKEASRLMLNEQIRQAERERSGLADPELSQHASRPLTEHLETFCQTLEAKGNTSKHVQTTRTRLQALMTGCQFRKLSDLNRDKASAWLRGEREAGRLSIQTSNYYAAAARQFGKWLMESGRLSRNPFAGVSKLNASTDRRVIRRALTDEELSRLIATTSASTQTFRGLTGEDRSALYATAAFTGLRVRELRSLTARSLNFEDGSITVDASYSKRRREDVLPLHPWLAAQLRAWFDARTRNGLGPS